MQAGRWARRRALGAQAGAGHSGALGKRGRWALGARGPLGVGRAGDTQACRGRAGGAAGARGTTRGARPWARPGFAFAQAERAGWVSWASLGVWCN